jgi:hypothetical protein
MIQKFFRGQKVKITGGELSGFSAIILWSQSDMQLDEGQYDDVLSGIFDVLLVDCDVGGYERLISDTDMELISDDRIAGENTIQEFKESKQAAIHAEIDEVEERVRREHPALFFVKKEGE